jgi:lysophospholipase L1-like esterase
VSDGAGRSPAVRRFVALGDSLTEGLGDPLPDGTPRGWADVLAATLAARQPGLGYANLAVRGLTVRGVLDTQVEPALALGPDLVAAAVGMNDLVQPRLDLRAFATDVDALFRRLRAAGVRVLAFTPPDVSRVIPLARLVRSRAARMRRSILDSGAAHGVLVIDLWDQPAALDPAYWTPNRLHPNTRGHRALADLAARTLGVEPLPASEPTPVTPSRWSQTRWIRTEMVPWLVRHYQGRSSADGRAPKRPTLSPPR